MFDVHFSFFREMQLPSRLERTVSAQIDLKSPRWIQGAHCEDLSSHFSHIVHPNANETCFLGNLPHIETTKIFVNETLLVSA